jgi:hypothetical protein
VSALKEILSRLDSIEALFPARVEHDVFRKVIKLVNELLAAVEQRARNGARTPSAGSGVAPG